MTILELLRQFAATNTDPAGSAERIAALRDYLTTYRTEHPDEPVDLAALDSAAMAEFETLRGGDLTAATLADMQTLADVCDAVREVGAADQAAADEIAQQAAALAARVGTGDQPGDGEGEGDGDQGGDQGGDGGDQGGAGEGGEGGEQVPAEGVTGEQVPALVASGRRAIPRVPLGALPNNRRRDPAGRPGNRTHTWNAAADIRGVAAGAELTEAGQLVEAVVTRMSSFGRTSFAGQQQAGIATVRRDRGPDLTVEDEVSSAVLERLTDEARLPGGSLVAAGGWCAPSEILYDLLPGADPNAGIIDLPTMTARRGGVRWPVSPNFSTLYSNANTSFYQTEATVIAGATPKPCYEIPCTTFNEERLGVAGVCVRAPILTERGYPELVRDTIAEIMAVHAHKVNQRKIADMIADATANTMVAADVSFAGYSATLLSAIELQVEYLRYRHRWSPGTTLELVLPLWARGTMRADLAGRNGQPFETVTDAQVAAHLAARGVSVQYVYDWQDSFATGQAADFGGTTPPKRFPATLTALIYRAGTYFVAESDVITVDGLYDSALLAENMHLALFTEEGFVVGKRDWPAIALTLPVFPGGYTGEQVDPPLLNLIPDPA
jgi:hypothetical protein